MALGFAYSDGGGYRACEVCNEHITLQRGSAECLEMNPVIARASTFYFFKPSFMLGNNLELDKDKLVRSEMNSFMKPLINGEFFKKWANISG